MNIKRLRNIWWNMVDRAMGKYRDDHYDEISITPEWLKFEPFKQWALENGYQDHLTIDRIDNHGDYTPDNCRWATWEEQARNKRNNMNLTAFGETKTVREWAKDKRCVVSRSTLRRRVIEDKLTNEDKLTTPSGNLLTFFGESKNLHDWLSDPRSQVKRSGYAKRRNKGWSVEDALFRPHENRRNKFLDSIRNIR